MFSHCHLNPEDLHDTPAKEGDYETETMDR